jgi:hypothetical protein
MARALRRLSRRFLVLAALGTGLLVTPPAGAQTPIVSAVSLVPIGSFQIQAPWADDPDLDAQNEQQQAISAFRNEFLKRSALATTCAPYYAKLPACTGETDA